MVNYREILRLSGNPKNGQRMIASAVHSSRHTIHDVQEAARKAGITWPLDEGVTNNALKSSGKAPEQGYKACASLAKLSERYGNIRLESACERILAYSSTPSIRNLSSILRNGQDRIASAKVTATSEPSGFGITRGAAYFRKGGERR